MPKRPLRERWRMGRQDEGKRRGQGGHVQGIIVHSKLAKWMTTMNFSVIYDDFFRLSA